LRVAFAPNRAGGWGWWRLIWVAGLSFVPYRVGGWVVVVVLFVLVLYWLC
jgi:hypothetical protein